METSLTIRPATLTDVPRLASLSGVLGYPVQIDAIQERLQQLLRSDSDVVFVAELEAGLIGGWIHGAEQVLLESMPRCELLGLVVDASCRMRGVGRRLVEAVENWAERRGLPLMSVRSGVERPESHPFYERLGYIRIKTQHVYRKPLPMPGSDHP